MRNALATIGAFVVMCFVAGALDLIEFRFYAGPDPVGFCERSNHGR